MNQRLRRAARALSEKLVKPGCRAWARRMLADRPADPIYEALCAFVFWEVHGYWPRFRRPRTFSEKLWHRGLYDRDPRWTLLSDKLESRAYIAERLGPDVLVPLLWSGTDPAAIPFDELPARVVVKTNHGCGYNLFLDDRRRIDRREVRAQVADWLRRNYCESTMVGMEWGYKHVPPVILVEEFLGGGAAPPTDYKIYCYGGRARFLQVNEGRYRDPSYGFFDRDFQRLPMRLDNGMRWSTDRPFDRPDNLPDLLRAAELIAAGLPFIRVDLYSVAGRVYVGELTCYPTGGALRFVPRSWDDRFGEEWLVPAGGRS